MVGEYRVDWKLAQGGMAQVYAATHPILGKKAAIKVIAPELSADLTCAQRFVEEARTLARVGHPNIVDVFSFGRLPDGRSFFTMEWLQGDTLGDRLFRGPLVLEEIVDILDQICDALETAHEAGIVHRDLKPDNVVLVPLRGGRVQAKLLDFGIAKLLPRAELSREPTCPDFVMGTPEYISPEQARGADVDHRTDLYALGVIAYEMVCGRVPFCGDSAIDVLQKQLHEAPRPPRRVGAVVPPALERLILRLLAKRAEDRPALREVRAGLAELRRLPTAAITAIRRRNGRRTLAASVAVALALGLAAGAAALRQETRPAPAAAPQLAGARAAAAPATPVPRASSGVPAHSTGTGRALPAAPAAQRRRLGPPIRPTQHPARAAGGQRAHTLVARDENYVLDPFEHKAK